MSMTTNGSYEVPSMDMAMAGLASIKAIASGLMCLFLEYGKRPTLSA